MNRKKSENKTADTGNRGESQQGKPERKKLSEKGNDSQFLILPDPCLLPFDIKFRYYRSRKIVFREFDISPDDHCEKQFIILDAGGTRGIASAFFPRDVCVSVNLREDADIKGDIAELPFSDASFDVVLCLDVLEHMEKEQRIPSLEELVRVTNGILVIGGPFMDESVMKAENLVGEYIRLETGAEDPNLNEHALFKLPVLEEIVSILETYTTGNIKFHPGMNLEMWTLMMIVSRHLARIGELGPLWNSLVDPSIFTGTPSYSTFISLHVKDDSSFLGGRGSANSKEEFVFSESDDARKTGEEQIPTVPFGSASEILAGLSILLLQEHRINELENTLADLSEYVTAMEKERAALFSALEKKDSVIADFIKSLEQHEEVIHRLMKFRKRILSIPGASILLRIVSFLKKDSKIQTDGE